MEVEILNIENTSSNTSNIIESSSSSASSNSGKVPSHTYICLYNN